MNSIHTLLPNTAFCHSSYSSVSLIDEAKDLIHRNQVNALKHLLENSQIDINTCSSNGNLLLQEALEFNSFESMQLLLERGADPNLLNKNDEGLSFTALKLYLNNPSKISNETLSLLCEYDLNPFQIVPDKSNIYLMGNRVVDQESFLEKLFFSYWSFQLQDLKSMNYSELAKNGLNFLIEKGFYTQIENMRASLKGKSHCFYSKIILKWFSEFFEAFAWNMQFNQDQDKDVLIDFIENFPDLKLLCPENTFWTCRNLEEEDNLYLIFLFRFLDAIFLSGASSFFDKNFKDPFAVALKKNDQIFNQTFAKLAEYHLISHLDYLCGGEYLDLIEYFMKYETELVCEGEKFSTDLMIKRSIDHKRPNIEAIKNAFSLILEYQYGHVLHSISSLIYQWAPSICKEYFHIDSLENYLFNQARQKLSMNVQRVLKEQNLYNLTELFCFKHIKQLLEDLKIDATKEIQFYDQFDVQKTFSGDVVIPKEAYLITVISDEEIQSYNLEMMLKDIETENFIKVYAALANSSFKLDMANPLFKKIVYHVMQKNNLVLLAELVNRGYDLQSEENDGKTILMKYLEENKWFYPFLFCCVKFFKLNILIKNSMNVSVYSILEDQVKKNRTEKQLLCGLLLATSQVIEDELI